MLKGIDLLRKWLDNLIEKGLAILPSDPSRISALASQLVDFGLPGVARKWRIIEEKLQNKSDWVKSTGILIGECLWLCKMLERWPTFTPEQQEDALTFAGVAMMKKEVPQRDLVIDRWLHIGSVEEKEENLRVIRNWFYGLSSSRPALFLQFSVNRFSKTKTYRFGSVYECPVIFYPSMVPVRVVDMTGPSVMTSLPHDLFQNLKGASFFNGDLLPTETIFFKQKLIAIDKPRIVKANDGYYRVIDIGKREFVIKNREEKIYDILSWSVHPQARFLGEYDGEQILILCAGINDRLIPIA